MPFSYTFLDERFNETYKAEQKTGQILGTFAGLTIFVACLGLFGLAAFTAEQRTKEIGVRKGIGRVGGRNYRTAFERFPEIGGIIAIARCHTCRLVADGPMVTGICLYRIAMLPGGCSQ
jgi:hypothetical protein